MHLYAGTLYFLFAINKGILLSCKSGTGKKESGSFVVVEWRNYIHWKKVREL